MLSRLARIGYKGDAILRPLLSGMARYRVSSFGHFITYFCIGGYSFFFSMTYAHLCFSQWGQEEAVYDPKYTSRV